MTALTRSGACAFASGGSDGANLLFRGRHPDRSASKTALAPVKAALNTALNGLAFSDIEQGTVTGDLPRMLICKVVPSSAALHLLTPGFATSRPAWRGDCSRGTRSRTRVVAIGGRGTCVHARRCRRRRRLGQRRERESASASAIGGTRAGGCRRSSAAIVRTPAARSAAQCFKLSTWETSGQAQQATPHNCLVDGQYRFIRVEERSDNSSIHHDTGIKNNFHRDRARHGHLCAHSAPISARRIGCVGA